VTEAERRVRRARYAAGTAGLRLHYDRIGGSYAVHGQGVHWYGLTIDGAEALITARQHRERR
jgi:hypothetical protein